GAPGGVPRHGPGQPPRDAWPPDAALRLARRHPPSVRGRVAAARGAVDEGVGGDKEALPSVSSRRAVMTMAHVCWSIVTEVTLNEGSGMRTVEEHLATVLAMAERAAPVRQPVSTEPVVLADDLAAT